MSEYNELIRRAYNIACMSSDPSTQVGAFLVSDEWSVLHLTRAYNTLSHGIHFTPEEWKDKHLKYTYIEHAERGSIHLAARYGIRTTGATMIASWAACAECAKAIVSAGIYRLVRHMPPLDETTERWQESVHIGDKILLAGDVEIVNVTEPIFDAPTVLRGGLMFNPAAGDNWHNHINDYETVPD